MAGILPEPTQKSRTWRVPRPLDQGPHPMCVGFGWKHFLLAEPMRLETSKTPAAPWLYHEAQKIDEWPGEGYDGTSVRAGAKVLQDAGHISEYRWAFSADEVRRYLLTRGTVVLGTDWFSGMTNPGPDHTLQLTGNLEGGHCYLAYRYDARNNRFGILNSWGDSWGNQGRAWLGFDELDHLIRTTGGEACSALECRKP